MLVNQIQLADVLDCTTRSIARWLKVGLPVRDDGRYDTADVVRWLVARKQRENGPSTRGRLESAKAGLSEFELDDRRALMVTLEDIAGVTGEVFSIVRERCNAIPGNLAPAVALENDPAKMERLIGAEIGSALRDISAEK